MTLVIDKMDGCGHINQARRVTKLKLKLVLLSELFSIHKTLCAFSADFQQNTKVFPIL